MITRLRIFSRMLWVSLITMSTIGLAEYTAGKIDGFGIKAEKTSVTTKERAELATEIAKYLKSIPAYLRDKAAPKGLSLSLLLDPTNKEALVLHGQLMRKAVILPDQGPSKVEVSDKLAKQADKLLKTKNADDELLAAHLLDLCLLINPNHSNAMYLFQVGKLKEKLLWDKVLPNSKPVKTPPKPGTTPTTDAGGKPVHPERAIIEKGLYHPYYNDHSKAFVKQQANIKGLVVIMTDNGMIGKTMDIMMTVSQHPDMRTFSFGFARTAIGQDMQIALGEAIRVAQSRYPFFQGGTRVDVSFRNKYSPKDGGSAGTAFSLLLLSLMDGFELDPQCAVTGDISVDWKVLAVGGIPAKIEAAADSSLTNVVVPMENERDVYDMVLLNSIKSMWNIHIIGADDLVDAAEIIRADRTDEIKGAMEKWEKVQKYLKKKGTRGINSKVEKALSDIRKDIPNSLSARIIQEYHDKKLKYRKLSLRTAVFEIAQRNPIAFRLLMKDAWLEARREARIAAGQPGAETLSPQNVQTEFFLAALHGISIKDLKDELAESKKIQRKLPTEVDEMNEYLLELNKEATKFLKYKKEMEDNNSASSKAIFDKIKENSLPEAVKKARTELDRLSNSDKFLKKLSQ